MNPNIKYNLIFRSNDIDVVIIVIIALSVSCECIENIVTPVYKKVAIDFQIQ